MQSQLRRRLGTRALSLDQAQRFQVDAAQRTLWLIQAIIVILIFGLLGFWPLDWFILPDDEVTRWLFGRLRLGLSTIGLIYLVALNISQGIRRNPAPSYTLFLICIGWFAGIQLGAAGGLDSPWFYIGYCMPGLTAPMLVPLGRRIIAAFAVTGAWSLGFFGFHPEHFVQPTAVAVLGLQSMMAICSAAVGHGLYVVVQRNWAQQQFIRQTFGHYFSDTVVDAVLRHHAGHASRAEERVVTVLFNDLSGYSTLVEHLEPAQVVGLLNAYFTAMQVIIEDNQGTVLEYVGDGILVVFGAPEPLPDHGEHAVHCARAMRERLEALGDTWEAEGIDALWRDHGIPRLKARCGIHTGRVVAGSFGGDRFMKYGIIGDTVNVAARLEALNKDLGTTILLSGSTHDTLPPELADTLTDEGRVTPRGRRGDVRVFST